MSKHQGPSAKTSEGGSSSGGGSNCSESPYYRIPSDRDSCLGSNPGSIAGSGSIVTIDAHAPHHPVVRVTATNGKPWEWRNTISGHMLASDISGDKHRAAPQRQDSVAQYRDYRTLPVKTDSQCSSSANGGTEGGAELPPPPLPTASSPLPPPPQLSSSPLPPPPPHSSSPLPPPPQPSSFPIPPPLPPPTSSHMPPPPHLSSHMTPPPLPPSSQMHPPPHSSSAKMPPPPAHPSSSQMHPHLQQPSSQHQHPSSSSPLPPPPHPSSSGMLPPPPHPDLLMDGHGQALSRTSTLPRRASVSARSHAEQEHYYKAMQNERML